MDVGPTLIVRLRGAPENVEGWRVRLVERSSENEEHPWNWCDVEHVEPDGAFAVRYRRFEREPGSEDRIWVQVEEPTATWKGEQEIDRAPGVHSLDIDVDVFAASLSGRVVNDLGVPLKASVTALRQGFRRTPEKPWPQTETDEQGAWRLSGLDPGPTRLLVVSDHLPTQSMNVLLERGEHEQLDIVLPSLAIAGSIEGQLVGPQDGDPPVGIVRLQSVEEGSTDLVQFCFASWHQDNDERRFETESRFAFENVPIGRYRLSLLPLDGRGYAPESFLVEAPATVEFRTEETSGPDDQLEYSLSLRDSITGAPLTHPLAVLHLDSFWVSQVQEGDPLQEFGHFGQLAHLDHLGPPAIDLRSCKCPTPSAQRSASARAWRSSSSWSKDSERRSSCSTPATCWAAARPTSTTCCPWVDCAERASALAPR